VTSCTPDPLQQDWHTLILGEIVISRLQWDFFEYLPVALQDAATGTC
jgi:hypothetical protein